MLYKKTTRDVSPESSPDSTPESKFTSRLPDPSLFQTFWINHASRAIMGRFEERLRPLGFGTAYLPVLYMLEAGPKQQKELLAEIPISQPTMTALLTRMEHNGVLTRETNPADRRAQFVTLTARARADLPHVTQVLKDVVVEALAGVSQEDQARLMAILRMVVRNLGGPKAREMLL